MSKNLFVLLFLGTLSLALLGRTLASPPAEGFNNHTVLVPIVYLALHNRKPISRADKTT